MPNEPIARPSGMPISDPKKKPKRDALQADARVLPQRAVLRELDGLGDHASRRREQDGVEEVDGRDVPDREQAAEADHVACKPAEGAVHPSLYCERCMAMATSSRIMACTWR